MASRGIVYSLDKEDRVIAQFECDWNVAVMHYHGKRLPKGGRYFVLPPGKKCPYPRVQKKTFVFNRPVRAAE